MAIKTIPVFLQIQDWEEGDYGVEDANTDPGELKPDDRTVLIVGLNLEIEESFLSRTLETGTTIRIGGTKESPEIVVAGLRQTVKDMKAVKK